jgi:hypothetical protein
MMNTILRLVVVLGLLCFFSSCSVDRCQIITHPSSAQQGDTISVLFSDIYIIISTTPTLTQTYTRDSLHAGYGLPAGWSVLSSDYYIATGIKMSQMASLMTNPSQIATLIQDSLAAYTARKSPMTKDNGWGAYFTGKTFEAHNAANNDSIQVVANNIGQWMAYSSKISLSVPSGTKMDTGVALTSLPLSAATVSQIKSFYNTDSIWVKAIPIVYFARVIASQAVGTDTLLYYTKTGPKPAGGISIIPNYDKGDMSYAPIDIVPNNAVIWPLSGHGNHSLLSVFPSTLLPGNSVTIGVGSTQPWKLYIFDASGKTVRSFSATGGPQPDNRIVWDGTSANGSVLTAGTYCLKLESAGKVASQLLHIIK